MENIQKATPIRPPAPVIEDTIVEVNMTSVYTTLGLLTVTTAGLSLSTAYLWRKVRRQQEDTEALAEFVNRLVNDTECGEVAYKNIVDRAAQEDTVDWSDEVSPYPEEEEESTEEVQERVIRRARSITPNI